MEEVKYIVKDNDTNLYFTGSMGDNSVKMDPRHTRNQAFNDPNSWVTVGKTKESLTLKWYNSSEKFLNENLRLQTEVEEFALVDSLEEEFVLKNQKTEVISDYKIELVLIPESYLNDIAKGFTKSEEFSKTYKFIINESKKLSILDDILFVGIPVDVTIFKRNDVYAIKFGDKYLSLRFSSDLLYKDINEAARTVNFTNGSDITQYTLTDEILDQGIYNSSLFKIIPVDEDDGIYRIENFHFIDTFLNIADDVGVFYPSILANEESEIIFETDEEKKEISKEDKEEQQKMSEEDELYADLGLTPAAVSKLELEDSTTDTTTTETGATDEITEEEKEKKLAMKNTVKKIASIIFLFFILLIVILSFV